MSQQCLSDLAVLSTENDTSARTFPRMI